MLKNKTIVLVGMMGSGKTTVGKSLSLKLNRKFIDSDQEIENASGLKIKEIFDKFGENYFRRGEEKVINRIIGLEEKVVLSAGGGVFLNKTLRQIINTKGVSVWLNANYKTLFKRLKKHIDSRPLFKGHNFDERLNYLINVREKYYKLSHVITKVDNNSVSEIVDNILKSLENRTLNDKSLSRS